jgi:hypothetical protein
MGLLESVPVVVSTEEAEFFDDGERPLLSLAGCRAFGRIDRPIGSGRM